MEMGDMGKDLPIDIVVTIIAMMPFPEIFKATVLSRSWYARFQTLSEIADGKQQRQAAFFQKQVMQRCKSWATFWPLRTTDVASPVGFNQAERKWQMLPSLDLSFVGVNNNLRNIEHLREMFLPNEEINLLLEGPLLYGIRLRPCCPPEIWVRNVLTGKCKMLPPVADFRGNCTVRYIKLISDSSALTYKVLLICAGLDRSRNVVEYFAFVHDSNSGSWSRTKLYDHGFRPELSHSNFIYLNGICYSVFCTDILQFQLAFNVEEETAKVVHFKINEDGHDRWRFDDIQLAVFDGNLIMVAVNDYDEAIYILKIDLASHRVSELAESIPLYQGNEMLDVIDTHEKITTLIHDVNNSLFLDISPIFRYCHLRERLSRAQMMMYNRFKDEWAFYSSEMSGYVWSECCFQPGLNPFFAV